MKDKSWQTRFDAAISKIGSKFNYVRRGSDSPDGSALSAPTMNGSDQPPEIEIAEGEVSPTSERRPSANDGYSKAFENFVDGEDDLVGLLAYAYYKASIRESARAGMPSLKGQRNPNGAEVRAYRSQAERELSGVARRAIEDATPDIEQTATANAIIGNRTEIMSHIDRRTGFWNAFGTNMLAWLASLFIAVSVIFLFGRPTVEKVVSDNLKAQENQVLSPEDEAGDGTGGARASSTEEKSGGEKVAN